MSQERNARLLQWAVANITKWKEKYPHLRSDRRASKPFFTSREGMWLLCTEGLWRLSGDGEYEPAFGLEEYFTTKAEVISREQWLEAKKKAMAEASHTVLLIKKAPEKENMKKQFTKSDLKTGMIIKQRCGEIAMVLLNTLNGDIYSGETWGPMSNYSDDLTSLYAKSSDIIAVYQPRSNCSFLSHGLSVEDHAVLWEEPKASTEHEILMHKIAEHEKSLAELKKQASKIREK